MSSPKKNQKVMSQEEKQKLSEGSKLAKERELDEKTKIKEAELAIFEEEKVRLPTLLHEKVDEIVESLGSVLATTKGLKAARIQKLISRQTYYSGNEMIGYSAKELFIVFQAYQDLIFKINEKTIYVPSLKNFCAFAGINTNTFRLYLQSQDVEKRNVAQMIDDYISDILLDGAKMKRIDPIVSVFEAKSVHNMAEAKTPQITIVSDDVDIDRIMKRVENIRSGQVIEAEYNEK